SVRWLSFVPVPACPRRPLTFCPEGETMIRTPLYAALFVALSQPAFAQSSTAPASAPVDDAPATREDTCARPDAAAPAATADDACAATAAIAAPVDRLPPRRVAGDADHYFAADGAADGSDDAQATGENAVASGA